MMDDDYYYQYAHLPRGFSRVSFDTDRQVYTFRDPYGELWEGEPGNQYGPYHRVADVPLCIIEESPRHPEPHTMATTTSVAHSRPAGPPAMAAAFPRTAKHSASSSCSSIASSAASSTFTSRHDSFATTASSTFSTQAAAHPASSPMIVCPDTWDPPTSAAYAAGGPAADDDYRSSYRFVDHVSVNSRYRLSPQPQARSPSPAASHASVDAPSQHRHSRSRGGSMFEKAALFVHARSRSSNGRQEPWDVNGEPRSVFEW